MSECACPVDGFCTRYMREMSGRPRELCQGINIAPEKAEAYRRNWLRLASVPAGPGEQLKRLLRALSIADSDDCGCEAKAKQMDAWGVEGCREHRAEIVSWLQSAAAKRGWTEKVRTGLKLLAEPWFNPLEPYGSIVDEAIRRAEDSLRGIIGGERIKRFDEANLSPGEPGKRFNASLIEDPTTPSGYLLAYRDGWQGSEIHLIRLDADFNPVGAAWRLNLNHYKASYGREDPRLFMHQGRLHVSYTGVIPGREGKASYLLTSVLYARLTEDCQTVEERWYPHLESRNEGEKNWAFFSSGGELLAVYSIAPHRILRIDGDRAEHVCKTHMPAPWQGGEMRGGAAPVLVGDEWWHFFHDRVEVSGVKVYRTGVYTFSAKPPFRVCRFLPEPIMIGNDATRPGSQYAAVVFTCGAVLAGDQWILSSGAHDRWTELQRFSMADLESRLQQLAPPGWWSMRSTADDPAIFASVAGSNEYGLPDDMTGWRVLDVGGHVGSFAYAARRRGAGTVHSYEPYTPSREHLAHNAAQLGNVTVFPEAIGAGDGNGRHPDPSEVEHSGGWSVIPGAGEVAIVGLDTAIERLGEVDLLKIDCEGGEWPAFARSKALGRVKQIVGEWHRYEWDGRKWGPEDLAALLEPHGFKVEWTPAECGWGLFKAWKTPRTAQASAPTAG